MKELDSTLSVIVRGNKILLAMKKRGHGEGKINGPGGKVEAGESVIEAMVRETEEELFVRPTEFYKAGLFHFKEFSKGEPRLLHVHTYFVTDFEGEPKESNEMSPIWYDLDSIPYDKMFADDSLWLPMVLNGKKVEGHFEFDPDFNMLSHDIKEVESFN